MCTIKQQLYVHIKQSKLIGNIMTGYSYKHIMYYWEHNIVCVFYLNCLSYHFAVESVFSLTCADNTVLSGGCYHNDRGIYLL